MRPRVKYKGVHFDKSRQKYVAQIKVEDVRIGLGRFNSAEAAAQARDSAAKQYFGEYAFLNFPESKETKMKALIIWEEVPESLKIYKLDNLDEKFLACQGKMLNCSDNTEEEDNLLIELQTLLLDERAIYKSDIKMNVTIDGNFWVIHCGFLM